MKRRRLPFKRGLSSRNRLRSLVRSPLLPSGWSLIRSQQKKMNQKLGPKKKSQW
jgi:hypothetical protein